MPHLLTARHGVDLIRRKHGVIEVQVAAAGTPWLHRGAHMGRTAEAQPPSRHWDSGRATWEWVPSRHPPASVDPALIDRRFQAGF